ncbi:MAG: DegT/DnrJ/EryC1/StrS family aminotransferase, partial [Candidatus Latescibacterota bacterium]
APILMLNCIPIFADADPETFNVDPKSVEERISDRTKAIIVAHIAGQPCDMDPLVQIARDHNLVLIEDASQSHDAEYKGRKAGTMGDIAVFSLMGGKHITAGGQGGMVITNNEELYWNAKRFADRGKPFGCDETTNIFLGLNYRMTELDAAIGRVQLTKLPQIVAKRREAVSWIGERISDLKTVRLGKVIEGAVSSYWFLFLHVDESQLTVSKNDFARAVAAEGVPASPAYDNLICDQSWIRNRQAYGKSGCPWSCPFYGKEVVYEGSCPNARKAIDSHMAMAVHECYTEQEADDIAQALRKVEQHCLK